MVQGAPRNKKPRAPPAATRRRAAPRPPRRAPLQRAVSRALTAAAEQQLRALRGDSSSTSRSARTPALSEAQRRAAAAPAAPAPAPPRAAQPEGANFLSGQSASV